MNIATRPQHTLRFGSFELDAAAHVLREHGQPRKLSAQPFRILLLLTERAGQIVSRQEIRQCLWGDRKYVEVDRGINFCLNQIRQALRDPAESARYIKTMPRHGYSFVAAVVQIPQQSRATDGNVPTLSPGGQAPVATRRHRARAAWISPVVLAVLALLAGDVSLAPLRASSREKDILVVADFSNTTGDSVFDDTLKEALLIELRQSPVLQVLPTSRVQETLKLMGRAADQHLTPDLARELCLRSGSNALVQGSIFRLGSDYVVNLRAMECGTDKVLADEQRQIAQKEQVLGALSRAAAVVRSGIGESERSVQRFDVPSPETTTSLDALQSYSQGIRVLKEGGEALSIPFFKRALDLDPSFAMADAALAARYNNLRQPAQALVYAKKAYELRGRVSERETLIIASRYFRLTGELEKMTEVLEMWISEFPHEGNSHGSLGFNYLSLGQYAKALPELQEAVQMSGDTATNYENLASLYIELNRPADAKKTLLAASQRGLDSSALRLASYDLAFIEGDDAQMQREVDWAMAKPGAEDSLLSAQADTEAYFGRLSAARVLSHSAVDSAIRSGYPESAALWQAMAALREAEFGERKAALEDAERALALATGRNVKVIAALAFARAGDLASSAALVDQIQAEYGVDTLVALYRLPVIKAAIALRQGRPRRALEILEPVKPYDFARPAPGLVLMYPAYLRGQAYLALGDARAAAIEFQKVIEQRGLTLNFAPGVLARLGLARAYAVLGDSAGAKSAYAELAAIWKQSDMRLLARMSAKPQLARARMAGPAKAAHDNSRIKT